MRGNKYLNVAPFNICSLLGVFYYLMSQILSGLDFCFTYHVETLIYSWYWEELWHHLKVVFKCLKEANIKIKVSKWQFFKKHLHYLGHLISEQGIQPLPKKVLAIQHIKEPSNFKEFWHFLSHTGYFRKFVLLCVDVTKLLNKLHRMDTKFQWSLQCQAIFDHLKQALCKEPILQYPSTEKLYTLFTDASHYAYSCILTQAVDSPEDLRPVAFTSGSFSEMQQRWSATEKEAYVVYQSVLKFDLHLRDANCV